MNVNKVITKDYENIANCKLCENKANTKPNKANTNPNKANFKRGRLLVNRMAKSQQHSVDIDKWLRLIGADSVGPNTCGKLINHFGSVDRPLATSVSELARVDPVAFKTAEQIGNWISVEMGQVIINHILTKNESVGTRTQDLRLKRPLLYQLSYTPKCLLRIRTLATLYADCQSFWY